ncbi:methionine sulfoxide reductase B [Chaetoceros tenuissimus]|uniref:Peptide-methionine (R)-S-oxide reductase n=1 Tax=Chaetoceros tenuissimus TaxID=426638 RepID=A0AAD3D531_9STRA|nr:methionine sulfoxide reductase B [Chaetoceros tenuissimus]
MLPTIQMAYCAIAALFLLCSIESCSAFLASLRSDGCSRTDRIRRQKHIMTKQIIFPSLKYVEENMESEESNLNLSRRESVNSFIALATVSTFTIPMQSYAATQEEKPSTFPKEKNRTDGYEVRHSSSEWSTILSPAQYNVLRRGGTERQRASILEKEKRNGVYVCAGCQNDLFASSAKFDSGTGWPSFDSPMNVKNIEIEDVSFLQAFDGVEVRCKTCGGHLGDLFGDGWRYGSKTGKRYCINGAALIFLSEGDDKPLRGDLPPRNKVIQYEPAMRRES